MQSGLPRGVGLLDAGSGADATLRMGLSDLGIAYVAGVMPNTLAWKPCTRPEAGEGAPKKGRRGNSDILWLREIALGLQAGHGARWSGARVRAKCCPRASHGCGFMPRIAI